MKSLHFLSIPIKVFCLFGVCGGFEAPTNTKKLPFIQKPPKSKFLSRLRSTVHRSLLTACCLLLTSTSCVYYRGDFHKQVFNGPANQELKTIGLLEPADTGKYYAPNIGHVGQHFSVIGNLIVLADYKSKENQFTELMKVRNFKIADEYQSILVAELQNAGYSVKVVKPQRPNLNSTLSLLLKNYDALDKDVDAYLDLGIGAGYVCTSGTADYIPHVSSEVRLVKRGTNEILYQNIISYGYEFRDGYNLTRAPVVVSAADKQYFFKNFGELTSDPDRALEGLRKGVSLIAKRIALDLGK